MLLVLNQLELESLKKALAIVLSILDLRFDDSLSYRGSLTDIINKIKNANEAENNEDETLIIPFQAAHRSFSRLKGVNFKFEYEVFRTNRGYNYLEIGIGSIPREKLNLKHRSKITVSYNPKYKHIIKIKKAVSNDRKTYSLSSCNPSSTNCLLRLRIKWNLFTPLKKWFGSRRLVKYEIPDENTLIVYLNEGTAKL